MHKKGASKYRTAKHYANTYDTSGCARRASSYPAATIQEFSPNDDATTRRMRQSLLSLFRCGLFVFCVMARSSFRCRDLTITCICFDVRDQLVLNKAHRDLPHVSKHKDKHDRKDKHFRVTAPIVFRTDSVIKDGLAR